MLKNIPLASDKKKRAAEAPTMMHVWWQWWYKNKITCHNVYQS
jgi:hypothetical protein